MPSQKYEEQDERIKNARVTFVPSDESIDKKRIAILAKSIHCIFNEYWYIPPEVAEYIKRMCSL